MEVKRQSEVGHVFLLDNSFWGMSANEHKDIFNCIIEESKINGEVPPFLEFKIGDREYTYYTGKKMMDMKLEKDIANKRYIQISIGEDNQEAKMNVIANFKYNIEKKYEPATSSKRDLNKENKPMYKIVNISELSREARIRRAKENPNISYTKGISIITKNGVVSSTSLDKLCIEAFDKLENIDGKLVDEESTDIKRVYKKAYLTDLSKSLEKEVLENLGIDESLLTKTSGKNEAYSSLHKELVHEIVKTRIIYRYINEKYKVKSL